MYKTHKNLLIVVIVLFAMCMFTGCAEYTSETREIEATVIDCKQSTFLPEPNYLAKANICLANGAVEMYEMYYAKAKELGHYTYRVYFEVDGETFIVTRDENYNVGDTVIVSATYSMADGEVTYVEYK